MGIMRYNGRENGHGFGQRRRASSGLKFTAAVRGWASKIPMNSDSNTSIHFFFSLPRKGISVLEYSQQYVNRLLISSQVSQNPSFLTARCGIIPLGMFINTCKIIWLLTYFILNELTLILQFPMEDFTTSS
ncbi:hypothetical protein EV360DRAFT_67009 [Lentinula raphanica]|nr:hypothetical protein EV360DRAFT_67009 [Lentinula raphanica]